MEGTHYPVAIPRWKRVLDVTLVLLAMPLVVPLMLCLAALIRLVSKGSVLFKQERVGYLGRRFMCLKFRTMFAGAEVTSHQGHLDHLISSNAPMVKLDGNGDSRIIPFGRALRASGLDEVPQLINVLRGEMSLVGPRPCVPYECEKYQDWQKERFNSLPGLTGLWQVNGKNKTTFTEMMQWDIRYVRKKTLWLDLAIMLRTPAAIFGQMCEARRRERGVGLPRRTNAPVSAQPGSP